MSARGLLSLERNAPVDALDRALSASHPPPCVFVYAPSNAPLVGTIVRQRLACLTQPPRSDPPTVQELLPKVATVDLRELHSPTLVYDRVLNLLAGWSRDEAVMGWNDGASTVENWSGRQDGLSVCQRDDARPSKRARLDTPSGGGYEGAGDAEWVLDWDRTTSGQALPLGQRNDSLDAWYQGLREIFTLGGASDEPHRRRFIVVESASYIDELASAGNVQGAAKETGLGMTFGAALLRLSELSRTPITTILISPVSWSKARGAMVGLLEPQLISFADPVSRNDIVNILTDKFEAGPPASTILDQTTLVQLFRDLVLLLHDTFNSQVGIHLDEMAHLAAKFWPQWLGFVESGRVEASYVSRLGAFLKDDLAREIERLANIRLPLPAIGSTSAGTASVVLPGFSGTMPDLPTPIASSSHAPFPLTPTRQLPTQFVHPVASPTKMVNTASDQSLAASLPLMAKFLLVASFYASFNTAKSDATNFVRVIEGIAKKGTRARKVTAAKPGTQRKAKISQDKLGPKLFPLERLLAIFEAIIPDEHEKLCRSADVLVLISSLVELRLLSRATNLDKSLGNVKFKCKVDRETVDMLARSVRFNDWATYLTSDDS